MSQAEDDFIRVSCPQCNKRLKAPQKLAGGKITCPKCNASVKLPAAAASRNDENEWLALDEDILGEAPVPIKPKPSDRAAPKPAPKPASTRAPVTPNPDFDDDEFKLEPTTATPKRTSDVSPAKPTSPSTKQPAAKNNSATDPKPRRKEIDESLPPIPAQDLEALVKSGNDSDEFRFTCKVCGTLIYKPRRMIGEMTQCPDCLSKFKIPAEIVVEKKKARVVEHEDVQLAPAHGSERIEGNMSINAVKETLKKAKQELDEEDQEQNFTTYDFDTAGWLKRTFAFVLDPAALVLIIVYGLVCGGILSLITWLDSWPPEAQSASMLLKIMVSLGVGVPVVFSLLANGLAVLESAANKLKRVREWPLFNMGEWIGEAVLPFAALALASVPGGILSTMVQSMEWHPLISVAGILVIIWLLFPALLISMLDNQSVTSPISMPVLRSFQSRPDAWGAMMLQTALMSLALFMLSAAVWSVKPLGGFVIGFAVPFYVFFLFQQLGILASRIADVTALQFSPEGDDDEEKEEDEESEE